MDHRLTIKSQFVPRSGVVPALFPLVCCRGGEDYFLGCPDCVGVLLQESGESAEREASALEVSPGYGSFEMCFVLRCLACGDEWETRPGSLFQIATVLPIWKGQTNANEDVECPDTWAAIH